MVLSPAPTIGSRHLKLLGRRPDVRGRGSRIRQGCKSRFDFFQLFLAEILEAEHHVAGVPIGADELVEFELDGGRVAVLGILEEEDHQEGHDGRAGIDDELPSVGVVEEGTCERPGDDDPDCHHEDAGTSTLLPRPMRGPRKQVRHLPPSGPLRVSSQ